MAPECETVGREEGKCGGRGVVYYTYCSCRTAVGIFLFLTFGTGFVYLLDSVSGKLAVSAVCLPPEHMFQIWGSGWG